MCYCLVKLLDKLLKDFVGDVRHAIGCDHERSSDANFSRKVEYETEMVCRSPTGCNSFDVPHGTGRYLLRIRARAGLVCGQDTLNIDHGDRSGREIANHDRTGRGGRGWDEITGSAVGCCVGY